MTLSKQYNNIHFLLCFTRNDFPRVCEWETGYDIYVSHDTVWACLVCGKGGVGLRVSSRADGVVSILSWHGPPPQARREGRGRIARRGRMHSCVELGKGEHGTCW